MVCDYCLNIPYDYGVQTYEEQANIMIEIGADVEDHLCDQNEESDASIVCECACGKRS